MSRGRYEGQRTRSAPAASSEARARRIRVSVLILVSGVALTAVLIELGSPGGRWVDAWPVLPGLVISLTFYVLFPTAPWTAIARRPSVPTKGRLAARTSRIKLAGLVTALLFAMYVLGYELDGELSWTAALPVLVVVPPVWLPFVIKPPAKVAGRIVALIAASVVVSVLVLMLWNVEQV